MGMYESLFPEEALQEKQLEEDLDNICPRCHMVIPKSGECCD